MSNYNINFKPLTSEQKTRQELQGLRKRVSELEKNVELLLKKIDEKADVRPPPGAFDEP